MIQIIYNIFQAAKLQKKPYITSIFVKNILYILKNIDIKQRKCM